MEAVREALVKKLVRETGLVEASARSLLNSLASLMTDELNENGVFEMPGVGRVVRGTPKADGRNDRLLVRAGVHPQRAASGELHTIVSSENERHPQSTVPTVPEITNSMFPGYTSIPPANADVFIIGDKPIESTRLAAAEIIESLEPNVDDSGGQK